MNHKQAREHIRQELEDAFRSRKEGNRGRARVCARRAAGLAARTYLEHRTGEPSRLNAYRALLFLKDSGAPLPPAADLAVERLTMRVDEDHQLPQEIDLIGEAQTLIGHLLDDPPNTAKPGTERP